MKALLTGSQVYGTPGRKSDIDLVLHVTLEELQLFREYADADGTEKDGSDGGDANRDKPRTTASVKFGRLNLILDTDPVDFAVWEKGTAELILDAPVDREAAVQTFRRLRTQHGLTPDNKPEEDDAPDPRDEPSMNGWGIGDPVKFYTNDAAGGWYHGLITDIDRRKKVATVSYRGRDVIVDITVLRKSDFRTAYGMKPRN